MKNFVGFCVVVIVVVACGVWFLNTETITVMAQDGVRVNLNDRGAIEVIQESSGAAEPVPIQELTPFTPAVGDIPVIANPVRNEHRTLQQRFIELMTSRAAKMTADELKHAISEAEREEAESTARRKLEEAKAIFDALAESHPDSKAANTATQIQRILDPPKTDGVEGAGGAIEAVDEAADDVRGLLDANEPSTE